ncbi:uncharacterized protein si:dkey-19b23.7 isoform X1 [Polyodon spathula]|uniref:uncharacterized protein si:dkey-19b23.7 isoform X1 n=1 Tax=Polyodon spathula TaxID=7913 RepID=UPI001B7E08EF|nr:uncharacterized protein si:dkey-19b23.7 isoform X1 [Polyodon spathula]
MSAAQNREKENKKQLQQFLGDLVLLGSLQGFQYFQPWLRGKEEMLLTVVNEDVGWRSPRFPGSVASSLSSSSSGGCSVNVGVPGSEEPALLLSSRVGEGYLLPASPSDHELAIPEVNCTLFLLAGYAKYGRPYAWIRSNHERLVNIGGADSLIRDTPMKLKSVADWSTQGTQVWEVVSELVALCTSPPPVNPFSLDMRFLQSLPPTQRLLAPGRWSTSWRGSSQRCNPQEAYHSRVVEDLDRLHRFHVQSLWDVQRSRAQGQADRADEDQPGQHWTSPDSEPRKQT